MIRPAGLVVAALLAAATARADPEPRAIRGYRVRGHTKVTPLTVERLAHAYVGEPIADADLPAVEQALMTSELFKAVTVALEPAGDGVYVVATLDDKMSWIAAPTVFVLPGSASVGAGYAENDLLGEDKKLLLYAQLGTRNTFLFGTYLDPSISGSHFSLRLDLYLQHKIVDEYANLDPRAQDIARTATLTYLDGGALLGYTPIYWLTLDARVRGAYVYVRDAHDAAGAPLAAPGRDGVDLSVQGHVTLDARHHRHGVTWGPYAQFLVDGGVPGLSTFRYADTALRATYAVRFLERHELELRAAADLGWHLPFQQEWLMGGASDVRGYALEQFRGDVRTVARAEYSVPLADIGSFAIRGLGFYDVGRTAFRFTSTDGQRTYLPGEPGSAWTRQAAGAGVRVYVGSIVLPLLGVDVGYGLESRSFQFYFELGLTDF